MPDIIDLKTQEEERRRGIKKHPPQGEEDSVKDRPAKNSPMPEISWQAPEYMYTRKSRDWYIVVGVLAVGLLAAAIILANFLFAIVIFLSGFTIALYGAKPPRMIAFSLSVDGIRVDKRLYPYESLKSFWIFYDPPDIKELSIESQKMLMPHIKISLGDQDPDEVRSYLLPYLSEHHQDESLIDVAARYVRF